MTVLSVVYAPRHTNFESTGCTWYRNSVLHYSIGRSECTQGSSYMRRHLLPARRPRPPEYRTGAGIQHTLASTQPSPRFTPCRFSLLSPGTHYNLHVKSTNHTIISASTVRHSAPPPRQSDTMLKSIADHLLNFSHTVLAHSQNLSTIDTRIHAPSSPAPAPCPPPPNRRKFYRRT